MGPRLLEIEPRDHALKFVSAEAFVEPKKQSSCLVQLNNRSDDYVAFKVKTTNPKKYLVRPNADIVMPNSTLEFTVTMQNQQAAPTDMQCRDKFLVQSTAIPYGITDEEIKPEWFSRESGRYIEDCKLRVVYLTPQDGPVLQRLNESFRTEMSFGGNAFDVPSISEQTVLEESPVKELARLKSPAASEYPVLDKDRGTKNSPITKENRFVKEDLLNDQQSYGVEKAQQYYARDAEELKLKLHNTQSRLKEVEKINSALREENNLIVQEKDKLQKELVMIKRDSTCKVQVGYPDLFVVFIGLVGIVLGYLLHR